MATAKGHLQQERKILQTIKQYINDDDVFPTNEIKSYNYFAAVIQKPEKGRTYSDQTGRFPYQSSGGTKYIFILYDYDSNAILKEELKDRTAGNLTQA